MNKSESKYFNTARLMNEALIKLLEVKKPVLTGLPFIFIMKRLPTFCQKPPKI